MPFCGEFPVLLRGLDFFDAGCFAAELADVIQLRAPDAAFADDFDLVDHLRMEREDAFDTVSERHLADGECGAGAAMFLRNANALEDLDAFLVAFLDLYVHFDGIARFEFGKIRPQLLFFNHVQYVHNVSNKRRAHRPDRFGTSLRDLFTTGRSPHAINLACFFPSSSAQPRVAIHGQLHDHPI